VVHVAIGDRLETELMLLRITLLWIGIVAIVPYAINQLVFHAQKDEYAFLIVAPLFWIFGFWGVAGPCIAAWRIHTLVRALEAARGSDQIREAFERHEGKEVVVDLVASEYRLPRFMARWVCDRVHKKIREKGRLEV
jgi:hypothetical protein